MYVVVCDVKMLVLTMWMSTKMNRGIRATRGSNLMSRSYNILSHSYDLQVLPCLYDLLSRLYALLVCATF